MINLQHLLLNKNPKTPNTADKVFCYAMSALMLLVACLFIYVFWQTKQYKVAELATISFLWCLTIWPHIAFKPAVRAIPPALLWLSIESIG
jgi:hypothetical protein